MDSWVGHLVSLRLRHGGNYYGTLRKMLHHADAYALDVMGDDGVVRQIQFLARMVEAIG